MRHTILIWLTWLAAMPLLAQTDYRNEFSVADTVFAQDIPATSDN